MVKEGTSLAMICPRLYPLYAGGVEKFVWLLSNELASRGFDVTIFSSDPRAKECSQRVLDGIRVISSKCYSPFETLHFSPELIGFIKRFEGQIIHAHGYRALPMLEVALAKSNDAKLIVTTHLGFTKIGRWAYALYNPFLGRTIFERADKIILVSSAELRELPILKYYEERIIWIPIGVRVPNTNVNGEKFYGEKLKLLYVGRLEKDKGICELMKLMQMLDKRKYELTIVGGGPYENAIRCILGKTSRRNIFYAGKLSDAELEDMYTQSSVFLLPSKYEGHSVALTEAMAHALVPVATDVGGNRKIIGNMGYLIEYPVDVREITMILENLYNKREELKSRALGARERAMKYFNIERIADMHERLYQQMS